MVCLNCILFVLISHDMALLQREERCNVVTQFGDELYQCKDPDVRARGQRVKVLSLLTSKQIRLLSTLDSELNNIVTEGDIATQSLTF